MQPDKHTVLLTPLIPRTRPISASSKSQSNGSNLLFLCALAGLVTGFSFGVCCGYFVAPGRAGCRRAPVYATPPFEAAISILEPVDIVTYKRGAASSFPEPVQQVVWDPPPMTIPAEPAEKQQMYQPAPTTTIDLPDVDIVQYAPDEEAAPMPPQQPPVAMFRTPAAGASHYLGKHYSQVGQDDLIDELLDGLEGGFFVESGAYNGVDLSNTLFLEATRGWSGLLVEANPYLYKEIIGRSNRTNAVAINACISPSTKPSTLPFRVAGPLGGLVGHMSGQHVQRIAREIDEQQRWAIEDPDAQKGMAGSEIDVQCWPLHSMLEVLGQTRVDYWSLDTEGSEAEILRATDFSRIDVRVMTVEVNDAEAERAVLEVMADKPYDLLIRLESDLVFVKRGAFDLAKLRHIAAYDPLYASGLGYTVAHHASGDQYGADDLLYAAMMGSDHVHDAPTIADDRPEQWFEPDFSGNVWPRAQLVDNDWQ